MTCDTKTAETIFLESFVGIKTKISLLDNSMWLCPVLMKYTFGAATKRLEEMDTFSTVVQNKVNAKLIHFLCRLGLSMYDACLVLDISDVQGKSVLRLGCLEIRNYSPQNIC